MNFEENINPFVFFLALHLLWKYLIYKIDKYLQGSSTPPPHPGRSWTIAGSSFANIFPEHLRTRSREEGSRESPDSTPQVNLGVGRRGVGSHQILPHR